MPSIEHVKTILEFSKNQPTFIRKIVFHVIKELVNTTQLKTLCEHNCQHNCWSSRLFFFHFVIVVSNYFCTYTLSKEATCSFILTFIKAINLSYSQFGCLCFLVWIPTMETLACVGKFFLPIVSFFFVKPCSSTMSMALGNTLMCYYIFVLANSVYRRCRFKQTKVEKRWRPCKQKMKSIKWGVLTFCHLVDCCCCRLKLLCQRPPSCRAFLGRMKIEGEGGCWQARNSDDMKEPPCVTLTYKPNIKHFIVNLDFKKMHW